MKDPVTVVQYFTNRYKQFKDLVIDRYHDPIYKVTDHFLHYEFATRGSIHISLSLLIYYSPTQHQWFWWCFTTIFINYN